MSECFSKEGMNQTSPNTSDFKSDADTETHGGEDEILNDVNHNSADIDAKQNTNGMEFDEKHGWIFNDMQKQMRLIWSEAVQEWIEFKEESLELVAESTSNNRNNSIKYDRDEEYDSDELESREKLVSDKITYSQNNNMRFNGKVWIYSDPISSKEMAFDDESKTWVLYDDNDPKFKRSNEFQDRNDGTTYEWDSDKRGWVPKITEDFLAFYHATYGNIPLKSDDKESKANNVVQLSFEELNKLESSQFESDQLDDIHVKRKRKTDSQKDQGWFEIDDDHNTSVYIKNLPSDITNEEIESTMSKCGIIAKELDTNKLKLKLYKDDNGTPKGDALCTYVKKESVDLAINVLDGYQLRPGKIIQVERAHFEMKGEFNPLKRKKMSAKMKKKLKDKQEKLFDWRPEKLRGDRPKSDLTIVLKNLFDPNELLANAALLLELNDMLRNESSKYGECKKTIIYDNNSEGVATVKFGDFSSADDFLKMTDYRMMRGRQLRAERWDGKSQYRSFESEEQKKERLQNWEKYLDQ